MNLTKLRIGQTHRAPSATSVAKAMNFGSPSPWLALAVSSEHRPDLVRQRDDAVWQATHCHERGDAHDKDKWWRIATDLTKVLAATELQHRSLVGRTE